MAEDGLQSHEEEREERKEPIEPAGSNPGDQDYTSMSDGEREAGMKDEGGSEEERPKLRGKAKLAMLKEKKKNNTKHKFKSAVADWAAKNFKSLKACAKHHGVKYKTLHAGLVQREGTFQGQGRSLKVLQPKEEQMIVKHVLYKASVGYGDSWETLRFLLQELLTKIKVANPKRITGLEDQGQLPSKTWVRRFAHRHSLSLRKCSIISKGRAVISLQDIAMWFGDIGKFLEGRPDLLDAMKDPRRIFNQDETAIEHGVSDMWVLARKGEKQVYGVSSSTREHTTISFTVSADGGVVEPRMIFAGKRDIAKNKLTLPLDGMTGVWQYSYTENGWVQQSTYLDILNDLVRYVQLKDIPLPIILLIDGASCHLSLEMAQLCLNYQIQPILLRPNTTHLCQALDLTFFASLKAGLKTEQELWHRETSNIGSSLSKYTVVNLVHKVAERIIADKPGLIAKGFRKAGIFPWNPSAPTSQRMLPSQVYIRDNIQKQTAEQEQLMEQDPLKQEEPMEQEQPGEQEPTMEQEQPMKQEQPTKQEQPGEQKQPMKQEQPKEQEKPGEQEPTMAGEGKEQQTPGVAGEHLQQEPLLSGMVMKQENRDDALTIQESKKQESASSQGKVPEVLPPVSDARFLAKFELLLTEEQVNLFNKTFTLGNNLDSTVYKAWVLLKQASLPTVEHEIIVQVMLIFDDKY